MSDLQLLFLVLAALYGWECACWLRRGSVGAVTWLGRTWRLRHPGAMLGNHRGGFVWAAPLPPLGALVTAIPFPVSLSPDTALAFVSANLNPGWRPPQSGRALDLEALREVRADKRRVLVDGRLFLEAATPGHARLVAAELARLGKLKPAQRASAIRELAARTLDATAVRQRWEACRAQSRGLRRLGNALFAYVFVAAPLVTWYAGLALTWGWLLGGLFALTTASAVLFRRAHRALYPDAGDERFTHTLTIALSPANAMRAHDALSRPLFEGVHPLAVAAVLLPEAAFRAFARLVLLDLRHPARPLCPEGAPALAQAEAFWRGALLEAAEALLRGKGVIPEELGRPPRPQEDCCRSYCPRCEAQFTLTEGSCAECGGLPLVSF